MDETSSGDVQTRSLSPAVPGPPEAGEMTGAAGSLIERLLREPEVIWRQIEAERDLGTLNRQLLLCAWLPLSVQGAVLGASSGVLQALASAVKLPVVFLLTLAICLPALYLFNLVFGSRLRASQTLAIVSCGIATTGVLTLGFAPISVFFLLSARSYVFFKLLNVGILALTGFAGLRVLQAGMSSVRPRVDVGRGAPGNHRLPLRGWLVVYAFVGTQLGWTLRPFFGAPGLPFELFRKLEGNFYVNIIQTLLGNG